MCVSSIFMHSHIQIFILRDIFCFVDGSFSRSGEECTSSHRNTFSSSISSFLSFCFLSLGATVPSCCAGSEKAPVTRRSDQPAERCRGHTLLLAAGSASGSGVPREAES